jgi:hypothetical protein
MTYKLKIRLFTILFLAGLAIQSTNKETLKLEKNTTIALVGNNLASRMMDYGTFETELYLRYPH